MFQPQLIKNDFFDPDLFFTKDQKATGLLTNTDNAVSSKPHD